ncbi:MAG: ABC transporter permease [Gammaproteobacteria bacterium]|nr:ABC transporter permease [Gammaproteobacteria bacterium]MBU2676735.1 ABC transporter permease [Gammaproteobacteria bacterium]NNC57827.1 ABC transporter permease [Woeseiaceae bacterium]NNL50470.1 ABC transporter permease [Woeseiaceae bacterium]
MSRKANSRTVSTLRNRLQLVSTLTLRDLKVNYDRSVLGFAWTLASPMLQLGVLYVVFHIILKLGGPKYPAYVFIGLLGYGWFQSSAVSSCVAVIRSPELILRPEFPRWVLPIIPVTVGAVQFLLALPLAFLLAFIVGAELHPIMLSLPLIALLQALVMLPIAFVAAALNSHYRDVQQIIQVVTLLFFFLTPIFYSRSDIPADLTWIIAINPMAYIVDAYRAAILGSTLPPVAHLLHALLFVGVGTPLAVWLYSRLSYRFVEDM